MTAFWNHKDLLGRHDQLIELERIHVLVRSIIAEMTLVPIQRKRDLCRWSRFATKDDLNRSVNLFW
jgi:hypothetical protein